MEGPALPAQLATAYTQSLVASLIDAPRPRRGAGDREGLGRQRREIIANDVEILESIAAGVCDVGITNHYYLARELADDPDFPVKLFWANQEDRGVHVNISGAGVTKYADDPDLAAAAHRVARHRRASTPSSTATTSTR